MLQNHQKVQLWPFLVLELLALLYVLNYCLVICSSTSSRNFVGLTLINLHISMIRLRKAQGLQEHLGSLVLTWTPTDLKKVNLPSFHYTSIMCFLLVSKLTVFSLFLLLQLGSLVALNLWTRKTTRSLCRRFVSSSRQIKVLVLYGASFWH